MELTTEQIKVLRDKSVENLVGKILAGKVPTKAEQEILDEIKVATGDRVTISRLNDMTGLDRRTLKKRLKPLMPDGQGKYDMAEALRELSTHGKPASDKAKLEQKKLRLQCQRIKFGLDVDAKRYISIDEVKRAYTRSVVACKSKFMAIGRRLCQRLAAENDPGAIQAAIDGEVRAGLEELYNSEWMMEECKGCPKIQE